MSSLTLSIWLFTFLFSAVFVNCWFIETNNSPYDGTLTLQLFDSDTLNRFGARCLDGSPAGIYYRPGNGTGSSTRFMIYLEGGAFCGGEADCIARSQTALGSSNYWTPTIVPAQPSDIISNNTTTNPYFGTFNTFFIPYCSGDLWLGSNINPNPISWNLTFAGTPIFNAAIYTLINKFGLGHATEVVLTGVSAGGMGVFYHLDRLADTLNHVTMGNARLVGVPQAGWFSVANSWNTWLADPSAIYAPPVPDQNTLLFVQYIVQYTAPPICDLLTDAVARYNCTFYIPGYYRYVHTPMFVAENLFDAYQIYLENGVPQVDNTTVAAYYEYYGNAMRTSLNANIVNGWQQFNGLYAPPCLEHEMTYSGPNAYKVHGKTFVEAFTDWYFGWEITPSQRFRVDNSPHAKCFGNQ